MTWPPPPAHGWWNIFSFKLFSEFKKISAGLKNVTASKWEQNLFLGAFSLTSNGVKDTDFGYKVSPKSVTSTKI